MTMSVVGRRCGRDDKARQPCVDDAPVSEPTLIDIPIPISTSVTKCFAKVHTATVPSSEHMLSIECASHARYRGQDLTKHTWSSCSLVRLLSGPLAGNAWNCQIGLSLRFCWQSTTTWHFFSCLKCLCGQWSQANTGGVCVRVCVCVFVRFVLRNNDHADEERRAFRASRTAELHWSSSAGVPSSACEVVVVACDVMS